MRLLSLHGRVVAFILLVRCASAQIAVNLPECFQRCISQYDSECDRSDISCICRLTRGDLLPDVIQCYENACNYNADINLLISALQPLCQLALTAISTGASQSTVNAEQSSSATSASVVTAEITTNDGDLIGIIPTTYTVGDYMTTTIVGLTTNDAGQTKTVAVPEIYNSATTITLAPIVVVGSTPTITRPRPVPLGSSSAEASSETITSTDRTLDDSSTSAQAATTDSSSTTGLSTTTIPSSGSAAAANTLSTTSTSPSPVSSSALSTTTTGDGTLFTPQAEGSTLKSGRLAMLTIGLIVGLYWW